MRTAKSPRLARERLTDLRPDQLFAVVGASHECPSVVDSCGCPESHECPMTYKCVNLEITITSGRG